MGEPSQHPEAKISRAVCRGPWPFPNQAFFPDFSQTGNCVNVMSGPAVMWWEDQLNSCLIGRPSGSFFATYCWGGTVSLVFLVSTSISEADPDPEVLEELNPEMPNGVASCGA